MAIPCPTKAWTHCVDVDLLSMIYICDDIDMKRMVVAVVVVFWLMVRSLHLKHRLPRGKRWWCWERVGQQRVSWRLWTIGNMRFRWCRLVTILHSLLCCLVLRAAPSKRAALLNPFAIFVGRWWFKCLTIYFFSFSLFILK